MRNVELNELLDRERAVVVAEDGRDAGEYVRPGCVRCDRGSQRQAVVVSEGDEAEQVHECIRAALPHAATIDDEPRGLQHLRKGSQRRRQHSDWRRGSTDGAWLRQVEVCKVGVQRTRRIAERGSDRSTASDAGECRHRCPS